MIEGWKFLKCWEKTAVPLLTAAGYAVKGDHATRSVPVRRQEAPATSNALLSISLLRDAKKGFSIIVAFAHDFARSFRDGKPVQLTGYEEAVFHTRVNQFLGTNQIWWSYGSTEADADKIIAALVQVAIAGAESVLQQLSDPGGLYLMLKKGDLSDENLWHLAIYADALGRREEALDWLDRMKKGSTVSHVGALKKEWGSP